VDFSFSFYLTLAVIVTGVINLLDKCYFRKRRTSDKSSHVVDYARAFFPILLIVWVMRSFIFQPYRVPTGSLEPTVMPGDFIAVEQFAYGLRMPVLNEKVINIQEPKRGDIALFRWPVNPHIVFVKRVIGLPGDHVVYKNKTLYINGVKAAQKFLYKTDDEGAWGYRRAVYVKQENLLGIIHKIYVESGANETGEYNKIVPPGHYFMMGDNRDNSDDGRQWGFVPERNLIGKAFGVWMSWDAVQRKVRWDRVGKPL
jgi:signal peptidase I